ncbi:class I SAM-dependent DNA methyltransferase [Acidisphaera rubrifaciens]|uniref:class I SAM-dependent DNA methyltransferase n=1 Tax=Acidisphaera rubrifaciens TaxID=50715 RepID=UPI001F52181A|nr:class I SAM-dependent methyltransferase [Acidisphaera rubrifaciens]
MPESLAPAYFDRVYARDPDPWRFRDSPYERAKYRATIDALPRPRFANAFEVGCSIGVLSALLAARCDRLLSVDVADAALDQARRSCAGLPQIRFERMHIPNEWPDDVFDLIVLSEVLYYLNDADVHRAARRTSASLRPGGVALLVHWTGPTDYPLTADVAAEAFITASALIVRTSKRTPEYRMDVLLR